MCKSMIDFSSQNTPLYHLFSRDGNRAGFFGYTPHPAPNGMGFNFNKWVWDGFGNFFLNPGRVRVLPPPRPALPRPDYI